MSLTDSCPKNEQRLRGMRVSTVFPPFESTPRYLIPGFASSKINFQESIIGTGNLYYGVAECSRRTIFCEFFNQIFDQFRAYFKLHLADHSDMGIIGKIVSSCKTFSQRR